MTKIKDLANRKPLRFDRKFFHCMRSKREKRMLRRGATIINKDLEIDNFLRSIRMLRIGVKTLFSRTEMFLLRNNKAFILNSESSESHTIQSETIKTNDTLGMHY